MVDSPLVDLVFTDYAMFEMARRGIAEESVRNAVASPQQAAPSRKNRSICQMRYYDEGLRKEMLLRVVVETKSEKTVVITAYKTSKIEKYWSP